VHLGHHFSRAEGELSPRAVGKAQRDCNAELSRHRQSQVSSGLWSGLAVLSWAGTVANYERKSWPAHWTPRSTLTGTSTKQGLHCPVFECFHIFTSNDLALFISYKD